MPWKVTRKVDARIELVSRARRGERVTDLAREYGIARKTAYKFIERYRALGATGLDDQSRAPKHQGRRTASSIEALILECKSKHATWGSRKLKDVLERAHPGVRFPARSTFDLILERHGLVTARKRRRCVPPSSYPLTVPADPNDVWGVDYKGEFRLGNGLLCYPLTTSDIASRFLLGTDALENTRARWARECFERIFECYGVPKVIRTDNGSPFASSKAICGLTQLSAFWLSLGIRHERIQPGQPQQNGVHERMHRTLKQDTARPAAHNALQQQERFDRFRDEFNGERPHEALAMKRPAELYVASATKYSPSLFDYPTCDDVRLVGADGKVCMARRRFFLSTALAGHRVGFREIETDKYLVLFTSLELGVFDYRSFTFAAIEQPSSTAA